MSIKASSAGCVYIEFLVIALRHGLPQRGGGKPAMDFVKGGLMSRWLLGTAFCLAFTGAALAQSGSDVKSGINSDSHAMYGPNIDVVNGVNANGTMRQQSPGSSMTNGAGNSTMTPGVTGGGGAGTQVVVPKITITKPSLSGSTAP